MSRGALTFNLFLNSTKLVQEPTQVQIQRTTISSAAQDYFPPFLSKGPDTAASIGSGNCQSKGKGAGYISKYEQGQMFSALVLIGSQTEFLAGANHFKQTGLTCSDVSWIWNGS